MLNYLRGMFLRLQHRGLSWAWAIFLSNVVFDLGLVGILADDMTGPARLWALAGFALFVFASSVLVFMRDRDREAWEASEARPHGRIVDMGRPTHWGWHVVMGSALTWGLWVHPTWLGLAATAIGFVGWLLRTAAECTWLWIPARSDGRLSGRLICDDVDASSPTQTPEQREAARKGFTEQWTGRDGVRQPMVIIKTRVHEDDVPYKVQGKLGYTNLKLPMNFPLKAPPEEN